MAKVLIIDDDPDILEVLQLTLQMEGFETKTNTRGEELFSEVDHFKPDIILLDILLSGSDGRVLCKQLKSDSSTKNIPVILISALPKIKETLTEYGANDFIPKPFDIDDLLSRVEKQLEN
ncbi:MAG TPA: response regulator [Candidatus Woesebacteria bacterium]|nr:response regulator [Candidatus Woesebacteria bacterium]